MRSSAIIRRLNGSEGTPRCRGQRGASAVEFALVAPILVTMMIGILQYGLYFNDALNIRSGVREGVRMGAVGTYPTCGAETTDLGRLKCTTRAQIGLAGTPTAVMVLGPTTWKKGEPLVVCAMVQTSGDIGLLPMPEDGLIRSKTRMSIETDAVPTGTPSSADAPLPGKDWSWCT